MPMGVSECARDLTGDANGLLDRELFLMGDPVAQRLALDERHDVIEKAVGFPRVDEPEDVRMLKMRSDLDLFQETVCADDGRQFGAEDLEGDVTVMADVVREVDRRHTAGAELALDAIAAREGGGETGGVGHRVCSEIESKMQRWRRSRQNDAKQRRPPRDSRAS